MDKQAFKNSSASPWLSNLRSFIPTRFRRSELIIPMTASLFAVLSATLVLATIDVYVEAEHLVICYLLPVTAIAIYYGCSFSVLTSVASGAAAAYFFFPPRYSLYIAAPLQVAELGFFILLAVLAGKINALLADDIRNTKSGLSNAGDEPSG